MVLYTHGKLHFLGGGGTFCYGKFPATCLSLVPATAVHGPHRCFGFTHPHLTLFVQTLLDCAFPLVSSPGPPHLLLWINSLSLNAITPRPELLPPSASSASRPVHLAIVLATTSILVSFSFPCSALCQQLLNTLVQTQSKTNRQRNQKKLKDFQLLRLVTSNVSVEPTPDPVPVSNFGHCYICNDPNDPCS